MANHTIRNITTEGDWEVYVNNGASEIYISPSDEYSGKITQASRDVFISTLDSSVSYMIVWIDGVETYSGEVEDCLIEADSYPDGAIVEVKLTNQLSPISKYKWILDGKTVKECITPWGSVSKILDVNRNVIWMKGSEPEPEYDGLCFTALEDGSYGMSHYGTNKTTTIPKLQYSRDGISWTDWFFESISVTAGDKVYFKGDNPDGISRSTSNYSTFTATSRFAASGNIMSILGVAEMKPYGFYRLFSNNNMIITAPELPATTLATDCYYSMFYGCASLTTAPELPAVALADYCYSYMFNGCTSLTTAPELPAITLANYCYNYMFNGCTSLTETPELPAVALANNCYSYMFYNCTSLTTAPEILPATTLATSCYANMFRGCTSLTTAPALPSITLALYCYQSMFNGCTSLTTAPELPATVLKTYCYATMFNGCSKLNSVKHSVINWSTSNASNWLSGVATPGVMRCPTDSTIPSNSASGIPSGWTRVNF